jgi:hypothetical protein
VVWADQWSDGMVAAGRERDRFAQQNYYASQQSVAPGAGLPVPASLAPKPGFWAWVASFFRK